MMVARLQFVGENEIDHTPRNETVRVTTGNAFDLVGERKQTNFKIDFPGAAGAPNVDPSTGLPMAQSTVATNMPPPPWIDETFEIKLRTVKKNWWKSAWSSISTVGAIGKSQARVG